MDRKSPRSVCGFIRQLDFGVHNLPCSRGEMYEHGQILVGGKPVLTLEAPGEGDSRGLCFTGCSVAPGRQMMLLQLRVNLPGPGETDLIHMPDLAAFAHSLQGNENATFSAGGAILLPFANRICGQMSGDGATLETRVADQPVTLCANSGGKKPGARRYAMHGLMLAAVMDSVTHNRSDLHDHATGYLNAGDFGGHWLSSTEVTIEHVLSRSLYTLRVTARNAGDCMLPMGIGWHPYFRLPGGDRSSTRLHVPAAARLPVNNYDEVLPTGNIVAVANTEYDFAAAGGKTLGDLYLDDCFVGLHKSPDQVVVTEIIDPVARYGLRILARSPEVSGIQVYGPPDQNFLVVEPQFNWADPYGPEWPDDIDTGMAMLRPGEAIVYETGLELFTPDFRQLS